MTAEPVNKERKLYFTMSYLLFYVFTILLGFYDAAITDSPEPTVEVCVGSDKVLPWTYNNENQLSVATWTKGAVADLIASKLGTADATIEPAFLGKFEYISGGTIKLKNGASTDDDTYKFSVIYTGASLLPNDESSVNLIVLDPPSVVPTGSCTGSGSSRECTCSATDTGTPAVDVRIKVDNVLQSTATATVGSSQTADCCVVGDAAKCMTENDGDTEYCVNIVGTTTTSTTTSTTTTTSTSTTITTTTTTPSPTSTTTTTTTTAPVTTSTPTTTTTTTTAPVTTYTPTTTTTTTTTPVTATTPSTTTTTTTPIPTTAEPPTTTTTPITTSTPPTTSPRSSGDSNKGLITMIIVVSVIGGILVIAIVFMVFVMVYWKSCLPLRTHGKGAHHISYRPDKHHHRRHHSHYKHKARKERSEQSSYQPQNVLAGYSFYRGGVKNPVVQEGVEYPNSTVVYYKDADEIFHAPRYDEQPPEYQYAVNWE